MGRISSGIGLVSGINSRDIIDQLIALESRPKQLIQQRIDQTNSQKLAYTDLSTRLTSLRISTGTLKKTTSFTQTSSTTSNDNVLTATTAAGAAKGSYQFQVARLVTAQQSVTAGFATEQTKVGAGTLTFELGGGDIAAQTSLDQLNGGEGVRRGLFRITDRSGNSGVIGISTGFSVDDVVRKINSSIDISVKAEIVGDQIRLTDLTGATAQEMVVSDLGGGFAATDLGLAGTSTNGVLTGADINSIGRSTNLADLNDGLGVRNAKGAPDFRITDSTGATFDITVKDLATIGQLIDNINTATAGSVTASVVAGSNALRLTDAAAGAVSVTALNSSKAAADLGIEGAATGTIAGRQILAGLNTILLSNLRGGSGLNLGTVSFTDRSGTATTLDFTGATTVAQVLSLINASGIGVKAELKSGGNGIQITDTTNGAGNLVITDVSSTTAAELGIAGTFTTATPAAVGANLQRKWLSENSLLASLNGGRGFSRGQFVITDSAGESAAVDLTQGNEVTLGDVIDEINAKGLGVTASINANGDGLLLTDTANGAAKLKVEEKGGTTAKDLGILGEAAVAGASTIDGSFQRTIAVTATDTLEDVRKKINELGFGMTAGIINDGSGATPFRLSLTARETGRAGRVVFDAGTTALAARNLVEAQDAAVFFGGADAEKPLVITSGANQLANVIKGVTIDLHGTSTAPVTLNITENSGAVLTELKKFAESFNGLADKLAELTIFDFEGNKKGVLLGHATVQRVETELRSMTQTVITGAGRYRMLIDVGVRTAPGGRLEVDEDKFNQAFAEDPEAVKDLFTLFVAGDKTRNIPDKKGLAGSIEDRINKLIDPVSGVITRQNKTLDDKTEQFQDRIEQLDKLLQAKKARLERQFANMEKVLANLQSQQASLNGFQPVPPMTASNSTSS